MTAEQEREGLDLGAITFPQRKRRNSANSTGVTGEKFDFPFVICARENKKETTPGERRKTAHAGAAR
jgi:2-oxo-4-hydroxy-4-carboxy--5-ureidoimidazoline (OHCU) decarboxylase